MSALFAWLNGKKTYLVAIAAVAYAWLGVYTGHIDTQTAIDLTFGALGLSALRHGVEKSF